MRACAAGRGSCASRHTQAGCDCQGLFSPPEGEGAAPCFGLTGVHEGFPPVFGSWTSASCPSIPRCLWVPVGVPTRGCAREAAPLLHRRLVRNTVGCAAFPPLAGLTCTDRVSSCLRSPARDCCPLASLIFPNLYICFCKFSGKLRSNLFHPVIPSPPPPHVRFIFFSGHILHYVKHR